MTWDASAGRTLLFGGQARSLLQDSWTWDGQRWLDVTPATSPAARAGHALAHDPARARTVLFGGYAASGLVSGTWEHQWIYYAGPFLGAVLGVLVYEMLRRAEKV